MDRVSATELNIHTGQVLQQAIRAPIIIEKTGRPTAVVLSYDYFIELEDSFFGKIAEDREKDASWLSKQASQDFLHDL